MNTDIITIAIVDKFPNNSLYKSKYELCKAMKITMRNLNSWIQRGLIPSEYNSLLLEVLRNLDLNKLYRNREDKEV